MINTIYRKRNLQASNDYARRNGKAVWWVMAALAALAAGVWFGFPSWREHTSAMKQLPALQQTSAQLGEKLNGLEESVKSRTSDQDSVTRKIADRLTKLEVGARDLRSHLSESSATLYQRIKSEFDARFRSTESRVAVLESARQDDQLRIALLQTELDGMRDRVNRRLAAVHDDAARDTGLLSDRFARLDTELDAHRRQFEQDKRDRAMRHLGFEVSKNRVFEVAPGVTTNVTKINVGRRQVSGWMWIMPDRKTVWLKNQNAMQPVIFYSSLDGKRREVVFTHVTKDHAVGYALVPESLTRDQIAAASHTIARADSGGN